MQRTLFETFQNFFLHPMFRGEQADRREKFCSITLIFCEAMALLMGGKYYFAGEMKTALFISVGIIGVAAAIFVHRFFAKRVWAVNIAMFSLFFVIIVPSLIYGAGGDTPGVLWIGNCIMFVNFLLNLEWTIFWGASFLLGIIGLNNTEHLPFAVYGDMSTADYNEMIFYTSMLSTSAMIWFSYQYKRSRDGEQSVLVEYDQKLKVTLSELSAAKEELQRRLEQNANLVRVISHDIATPLQVIKISQMRIPEEVAARKRIEKATEALTSILDYVREYRAVLDGKKDFKMAQVVVAEVLQSSLALFEERFESKSLKVKVDFPNHELKVLGDSKVLGGIVFSNLISNAVKFTQNEGTIEISLRERNGYVVLSIRDSGIGIPKHILENIFAIDKKTSRAGTNGEAGTGFGMPLVKAYVEMHSGMISIHSWEQSEFPANHGTLVEISIPLSRVQSLVA